MIYKIFDTSKKRYWLDEFGNKKDAVKHARVTIKQYYYDFEDESVYPSVRDYVSNELRKLNFVKFTKKDL